MLQDVVDELQARTKKRAEKLAQERRNAEIAKGGVRLSLEANNLSWKVVAGCDIMTPVPCEKVEALKTDDSLADVYVVKDLQLSNVTKLEVALGGGMLVPARYVETDGAEGWCCAFKRATAVARAVFVTSAVQTKKPSTYKLLQRAASHPRSKWKMSTDLELYKKRRATALRNKEMAEVQCCLEINFIICS